MSRACLLVLFGATLAVAGCAAARCEIVYDNELRVDECKAAARAAEPDPREQAQAQQEADSERAARASAGPACERGDPHACLTVGVYDERHHAARAAIRRAYGVACQGNLAFGCYGAGRFERDPAAARSLLARGCELGERSSCEAAKAP